MNKIILYAFFILIILITPVFAEDNFQLSAGVSVNEVPKALFGSWRISAKLDKTNSYQTFKPQSVDLWHLSRIGDVIKLTNPFTGVDAKILVNNVEGNFIVFTRKTAYDNKLLTDIVSVRLDSNSFKGINTLKLETFSIVDNHLLKTEQATYIITGKKISGENVIKD